MRISDADRRALHDALARELGSGPATTMMELLPPVGWVDFARRSDVDALRAEVRGELAEVRGDIAGLRGELAEFRGRVEGKFDAIDGRFMGLRGRIDSLWGRLLAAQVAGSFASAGLVIAALRI